MTDPSPDAPRPLTAEALRAEACPICGRRPNAHMRQTLHDPVLTAIAGRDAIEDAPLLGYDQAASDRRYLLGLLATLDAARSASPDPDPFIGGMDDVCLCGPNAVCRAALAQPEPLDAAWKAAEAALPDGWDLRLRRGRLWIAEAESPPEGAVFPTRNVVQCYEPTPAAALHALAETLRAPTLDGLSIDTETRHLREEEAARLAESER